MDDRITRWRLNAPPGYRWTDAEVAYEKGQSFCNGLIVGAVANSVAFLILGAIT